MSVDVLVCNFTRFGDLIQCQPLLGDLHAAGYSAGLLCLEQFAAASRLLRHISGLWTLPAATLMADTHKSWQLAAGKVLEFTGQILEEARPRFILNLTPSIAARILTRLLTRQGATLLGFGLDDEGYGLNASAWASFLSVAAGRRSNSPFNVADLLRNSALSISGGRRGDSRLASPNAKTLEWARKWAKELRAAHNAQGLVAFQLGASEEKRRWPIDNFIKLGAELWEKARLLPVLIGSASETELAGKYAAKAAHPFAVAMGKTDFQQLSALLQKCRLLVTNDTGTMHVAAGMDVPILAFFLTNAQAWDTAPLRPDCCCIEPAMDCHPCAYGTKCEDFKCVLAPKPNAIAEIILNWLQHGKWQSGKSDDGSLRMWITERDAGGLLQLAPANAAADDDHSRWLSLLHSFWSQTLDELDLPEQGSKFSCPVLIPRNINSSIPDALAQAGQLLASMPEIGKLIEKSPQAANILLKNSKKIQQLFDKFPELSTFALFWKELCAATQKNLQCFITLAAKLGKACSSLANCPDFSQAPSK